MAIDYGTKRVGIAVTDPLQIIATGLTTVATKDLFTFLQQYLSEEAVSCIVVGEPLDLNGQPAEVAPAIKTFKERLVKTFPDLRSESQDERFTSVDAKRIILQSGAKKKKRRDKALVDKISAVLILQDFLEHQR